jgi:hypothetical protein
MILKLDHATFPDVFAPDGRERLAELLAEASDLERNKAVRIGRHVRGPLAGEPKELRIGAAEVNQTYALAAVFGYEPLATGLSRIERHVRSLASTTESRFAQSFLENLADGLRSGDLSAIGMGRSKFKQEWRALAPAMTAALALLRGVTPAWERVISERLFRDSKLLGRIRHHVINLLVRIDPRWDGIPLDEASDLLEAYGVRRKPGLLRCAGTATIRIDGRDYLLEDFAPVAHLPDAWSDAWVEALGNSGAQLVTTIENEYPFLSYVEEAGGPRNLGAQSEIVVYTAGFPTPALVIALRSLSQRIPELKFQHWGDADVGGLRIWWFLRCRLERPVYLFRTTAAWVESELHRGGKRLSAAEIEALGRLKSVLSPVIHPDTESATELIDKLLEHGIKIEQERY